MPMQILKEAPASPPVTSQQAPAPPAAATQTRRKSRSPKSRRALLALLTPELVFTRPWFIAQSAGDAMALDYLLFLKNGGMIHSWEDEDEDDPDNPDKNKPEWYDITDDGLACIPIRGTLIKSDYDFAYSFATSYSCIESMCADAMARSEVKGILFCHDSPGGNASGMFDTCDMIYGMRGTKPMAAISDDACYSASYCLGSAADKLFLTRTAGVGSIGAWMQHVDFSKALEDAGIKVTLVHAGEKKVDGNQYEPLSARAEAEMQAEVDRMRVMFAQAVARNRAVSFDALMATEGGIEMAEAALPLLADQVGNKEDALAYLRGRIAQSAPSAGTIDLPEGQRSEPGDREGPQGAAARPMPVDHPSDAVLRLERPDGTVSSYSESYVRLMESEPAFVLGDGQRADATKHEYNYRRLLLSGLRQIKAQYPQAFAAIRTIERRASVDDNRKISLLAAPYAGVAQLGSLKETYRPGCFRNGLGGDLRVLWNHADTQMYVLGRTSANPPTAHFWEAEDGLRASADAPKTQWADDLLVSMRRGDVTEASLAFWILESEIENRADGKYRIITRAVVHDASVESFGAYTEATSTADSTDQNAEHDNRRTWFEIAKRRVI